MVLVKLTDVLFKPALVDMLARLCGSNARHQHAFSSPQDLNRRRLDICTLVVVARAS